MSPNVVANVVVLTFMLDYADTPVRIEDAQLEKLASPLGSASTPSSW